jgi:peroxiredoxin
VTPLTGARHMREQTTWTLTDDELVECLLGLPVPRVRLLSTAGGEVDLAELAAEPVIVYVHPGTETLPEMREDPDGLLGTGCTVQSHVFDEYAPDFAARNIRIFGLSARSRDEQRRFVARERLMFPLLSDEGLQLADAIDLPTFLTPDGERVYRRVTFFARAGVIEKVFFPVPIPRRNAIDILSWMAKQGAVL